MTICMCCKVFIKPKVNMILYNLQFGVKSKLPFTPAIYLHLCVCSFRGKTFTHPHVVFNAVFNAITRRHKCTMKLLYSAPYDAKFMREVMISVL